MWTLTRGSSRRKRKKHLKYREGKTEGKNAENRQKRRRMNPLRKSKVGARRIINTRRPNTLNYD